MKEPSLLKPRGRVRVRWRRAARGMPARAGIGACAAAREAARGTRARMQPSRRCVPPETEGRPARTDTGRVRFLKPNDLKSGENNAVNLIKLNDI